MSDLVAVEETEADIEEASVNAVVDATPVIDDQPTMSPQVLWAFTNDVAQNIMPYTEVAVRYGFVDVPQLRDFLVAQHMIRKRIKELRAIWESDDNVETRIRTLAGHSVLAAIPGTAQIMLNPRLPDSTRLDALKEHAQIAGVRTGAWGNNGGPGGMNGMGPGRFSVNIVFQNAGRTETITTVEHTPPAEDAT